MEAKSSIETPENMYNSMPRYVVEFGASHNHRCKNQSLTRGADYCLEGGDYSLTALPLFRKRLLPRTSKFEKKKKKNRHGLSPRANYTDRVTADVGEVIANFCG
jgi:hypothetical protein